MNVPRRSLVWVAALLPTALLIILLAWLKYDPPRTFETRERGRRHEVFVVSKAYPSGHWHPLVESTRSPLVEFVPAELTPGPVAHLNADGTVVVTTHVEAGRRSGWDALTPGYPRPAD